MIAVVQRVTSASVEVADPPHRAAIDTGLLVLVAIEPDDSEQTVAWMARKLVSLRVFPDEEGRMNLSLPEVKGRILLISQFTLAGNCEKGHRPSFIGAAPPEQAAPMMDDLAAAIRSHGTEVGTGVFGGDMRVESVNQGPVTLVLKRVEKRL